MELKFKSRSNKIIYKVSVMNSLKRSFLFLGLFFSLFQCQFSDLCPENLLLDPETMECYSDCPVSYPFPERKTRTCIENCPLVNQYYNSDIEMCKMCPENCLRCSSESYCTGCDYSFTLFNNSCVAQCPNGTYLERTPKTFVCEECHPTCETCTGSDEASCSSCGSGRYLNRGKCLSVCFESYFFFDDSKMSKKILSFFSKKGLTDIRDSLNSDGNGCLPCHDSCKTCNAPYSDSCLTCFGISPLYMGKCYEPNSCPLGTYINPETLSCVDHCPQDMYPHELLQRCLPCESECEACISKDECYRCQPGFKLQAGQCVEECGDGFFYYEGNCDSCHYFCAQCSGPNYYQCSQCQDGFVLKYEDSETVYSDEGACLVECPGGMFDDSGACKDCVENCEVCTGIAQVDCQKCTTGKFLVNSICIDGCPDYTYLVEVSASGNEEKYECYACGSSCRVCTADDECTDCDSPTYLYEGTCYTECPGDFLEDTGQRKCVECEDSITHIYNTETTQCTPCDSFTLTSLSLDGYCNEICGDGAALRFSSELTNIAKRGDCDDGNLVSGDGCSADCSIEDGYVCYGGNTTHEDQCSLLDNSTAFEASLSHMNSDATELYFIFTSVIIREDEPSSGSYASGVIDGYAEENYIFTW